MDAHLPELGRALRELRTGAGLTTAQLAERSGVARRSVMYVQAGRRRIRRSMAHALAVGIDPEAFEAIRDRLVAAAGPDGLAADTPGWWRYRVKRLEWAEIDGHLPPGSVIARVA